MPHRKWERNDQMLSDRAMGMTLAAVGAKWGVDRNRVWQIEQRAVFEAKRRERAYGLDASAWLRHIAVLDEIAGLV